MLHICYFVHNGNARRTTRSHRLRLYVTLLIRVHKGDVTLLYQVSVKRNMAMDVKVSELKSAGY